jgi:hypothetical protein
MEHSDLVTLPEEVLRRAGVNESIEGWIDEAWRGLTATPCRAPTV